MEDIHFPIERTEEFCDSEGCDVVRKPIVLLFLILVVLSGCAVRRGIKESEETMSDAPYDVRIEFNGLAYELCWEYDYSVVPKYRIYHSLTKITQDEPGTLLAEVSTRKVPLGILSEELLVNMGGYLAVQAVSETGVVSPISESIYIDLLSLGFGKSEYNVPDEILVVNLLQKPHDLDELLMIKCIQGIVNRKYNMPKIYVVHKSAGPRGDSVVVLTNGDVKWLEVAREKLGVPVRPVDFQTLFEMYKGDLAGQVIYDKSKTENVEPLDVEHYWTIPLAVTYAGLYNAIVTPEEIEGLPVLFDFRDKNWTKLEAYEWALQELVPKVNKEFVFLNDAFAAYNTDFVIDKQALFMDLNSNPGTPEREMALRILKQYPRITPVLAWTHKYGSGEYKIVQLIDESGHTLLSDVGACTTNLSFHSRIDSSKPIAQHTKYVEYDRDMNYVTLIYSDGDAMGYINLHLYQAWHWNRTVRGEFPIGWQLSPFLGQITPYIAEAYYDESTMNDEFVLAVNGLGYSLPGRLNRLGFLDRYLYEVSDVLSIMDFKTVNIVDYEPQLDSIDAWITEYARRTQLDALFIEGGAIDEKIGPVQSPLLPHNRPPVQRLFEKSDGSKLSTFVMAHRGRFVDEQDALRHGENPNDNVLARINRLINDPISGTKFIFVYVYVYYMDPVELSQVVERLPDNVQLVSPSTFANLFHEHHLGVPKETNAVEIDNVWIHVGSPEENALFASLEIKGSAERVEFHYRLAGSDDIFVRNMTNMGNNRYAVSVPQWTNQGYTEVLPVMIRVRTKDGGVAKKLIN